MQNERMNIWKRGANMNKKFTSLSILGMALALAFVMGGYPVTHAAQGDTGNLMLVNWYSSSNQMSVDRDLGTFHKGDVNQFGDDRAYTGPNGADRDADFRAHNFAPNTYGLMGDYWYDNGPGSGS
jgi:hypothetical protein